VIITTIHAITLSCGSVNAGDSDICIDGLVELVFMSLIRIN